VSRFGAAVDLIAIATRSGYEESVHHGAAAAVAPDGSIVAAVGTPTTVVYPRSCLKPLQVDAMLALGLELPDELVAVACASHDGANVHLDAVRALLHRFGLTEADLGNTPAPSLCDSHAEATASALRHNCSGKHAAMLATCVVNGWPSDTYLDPAHPLQEAITAHIVALGCAVHHIGVDGCGAPTHAVALDDLARVFARFAANGSVVARAMSVHPVLVGGVDRDVTAWMQAVPGLLAKEGAAGVMAAGLADGSGVAFKVADGSDLARRAVVPQGLRTVGVDVDGSAAATRDRLAVPVLGHGRPVGSIEPVEWLPWSS
jgi:L-asparaginase II